MSKEFTKFRKIVDELDNIKGRKHFKKSILKAVRKMLPTLHKDINTLPEMLDIYTKGIVEEVECNVKYLDAKNNIDWNFYLQKTLKYLVILEKIPNKDTELVIFISEIRAKLIEHLKERVTAVFKGNEWNDLSEIYEFDAHLNTLSITREDVAGEDILPYIRKEWETYKFMYLTYGNNFNEAIKNIPLT